MRENLHFFSHQYLTFCPESQSSDSMHDGSWAQLARLKQGRALRLRVAATCARGQEFASRLGVRAWSIWIDARRDETLDRLRLDAIGE
jgi:hypothetical protein